MRLRLIPVLIVVASLGLVIKTGEIWQGVGALARIQTAAAGTPPAGEDAPKVDHNAAPDSAKEETAEADQPEASSAVADLPDDPLLLTDEEIDLLQRLGERRAEIDRRAAELEQRAALLEAAETRIDEKIIELENLKATLESLLTQHDEQEERQLLSLVKIYESMKPKDAARIFEELDMAVLLEVIERMKERKTAPILAQMNPRRAKTITIELAQRRSLISATD
jgi:flagellar motility protein MotE (MotC chaperone)